MDKKEILEKSRRENRNLDLVELEVRAKASDVGLTVGIFLCGILMILEGIFTDRVGYEAMIILFGVLGTVFAVKYAKLRRKHELVFCIFYYAFFAADIALLIREVVNG